MPWLAGVDDWLASYGREQRKNRTGSISTEEWLWQLFAISAVTERNFLT